MQANFEAGQKQLNSSYNLLCTNGRKCPGWGVDSFDGRVKNLMLTMTPNSKKLFHSFVVPQQISFTPYAKPQTSFSDGAGVFGLPSDFVTYANAIIAQSKGYRGLYSQSWTDVLNSYFQGHSDTGVSVVQGQVELFDMSLPTSAQGQFEPYFVRNLLLLPGNYSTSDEVTLFNRFFELYGTSMIVQRAGGGLVEQRSRWKTPLGHTMNKSSLLTNAQIDFTKSTGLGGHSGTINPTYAANRVVDSGNSSGGYYCYGGEASMCKKGSTSHWQATLTAHPAMLDYTTVPLTKLLAASPHTASDPTLGVAMEAAVRGYIHTKTSAWAAVNKCPKAGCNGAW